MSDKSVIIVAGGSGMRMNSSIPKQFMLLGDLPLLIQTINKFHDYDSTMNVIVVISERESERWKQLIVKHNFLNAHTIAFGGNNRFQSVRNGLAKILSTDLIAIHDGARPLCSTTLIKKCFDEAEKFSNAIPSIALTDSIRMIKKDKTKIVDRQKMRIIQTPQCFNFEKLKKAYEQASNENFTDDAGVFESAGNKIHLIEGEKTNIKITEAIDLIIANALFLFKK
jgi:2-C-methyl-D-erythritol 4-phosphate cytidylyltransferase